MPQALHPSLQAGVIADDLTGAAEMGVLLAAHGLRTTVLFDSAAAPAPCDALVIDTGSRYMDPTEAARRVSQAVSMLRSSGARSLFKKVDSTLRGNVEVELQAFSASAIFTPAYPEHGRLVQGGSLFLHGARIGHGALAMHDAASVEDLRQLIARHPAGMFAGSGGLGRAWVESLPPGRFAPPSLPPVRHPLLVCGSRHPSSRTQAQHAAALGIPVLLSPEETGDAAAEAVALAERASTHRPDLLILFGGDTAFAVLRRFGIGSMEPVRELLPGVALSTAREMMIVTKAGGFGSPDAAAGILRQLQ